ETLPFFAPSKRFDFELEIGAIVGSKSNGPLTVQQADDIIFGYVLLNDWSARDIQAWEGQPLGPFQAKATATTISPWIVTKEALIPFQCSPPAREIELLDHLKDCGPMFYDISLTVSLTPQKGKSSIITETNYKEMYYSSAQQIAHHSSSGCPMRVGDLIGSGTISGSQKSERGSMLELSWGGKEPLNLANGETRTFLEDLDTVTFQGKGKKEDFTIGFGNCTGTLLPALKYPY
ncbi:fumarylacetoacetate hydrolase family protein, partial [Paracoccaceae bacterium]|nr:fumarylacetoacetate hydrolase family protein [Paracoccaceae bacterium]